MERMPLLSLVLPLYFSGSHTMSHLQRDGTMFRKNKFSSIILLNIRSGSLNQKIKYVKFHSEH